MVDESEIELCPCIGFKVVFAVNIFICSNCSIKGCHVLVDGSKIELRPSVGLATVSAADFFPYVLGLFLLPLSLVEGTKVDLRPRVSLGIIAAADLFPSVFGLGNAFYEVILVTEFVKCPRMMRVVFENFSVSLDSFFPRIFSLVLLFLDIVEMTKLNVCIGVGFWIIIATNLLPCAFGLTLLF